MKLLVAIWTETIGLFVDDGALALLCVALIAVLSAAVLWLSLPAVIAGCLLLAGCVAILGYSVLSAVRRR